MIEGPIVIVENETQMTPLLRSTNTNTDIAPSSSAPMAAAALDEAVVVDGGAVFVVSHLPSHPSLNSLAGGSVSGAAGGHSSSASSVDGGATVSTAGTSASKRTTSADAAAVQQKVQDAWRTRREERDQREIAKRAAAGTGAGSKKPPVAPASFSSASGKQPLQPQMHHHLAGHNQLVKMGGAPLGLPMLCAMVQKGWKDAFDNKPKPKARKPDRPRVFPSMLSILEANALVTQVRNLQEDDDSEDDDSDDDVSVLGDSTRGADSPRDQAPPVKEVTPAAIADPAVASVLSILPAGYDWNRAILQMAQSRSRAFLLLDLAAIVRRTVMWKRSYPGITWVHSVSANANSKLLQVLLLAGVRLATTTRSDLTHALDAQSKLKKPPASAASSSATAMQQQKNRIADSTARSAPPDSYIRELLHAKVFAITVDGADEVHRVVRTVQRMQARHGGNSHGIKLELTLRLHPTDMSSWLPTAKETLAALEAYPVHELSGISLDVGGAANDTLQRQIEAERVKDFILKVNPSVKIHLTGFEGDAFPEEWVVWWAKQRADARVREVSVECSFPLIASAGALCTRIIGVRANVPERKQQLYIDDGCYGSLYQTKGDLKPIPLGNYGAATTGDPAAEQASYTTTVWGPTCDGLDWVCRDISLPKLERDEWVVFPNLGCPGAQGTAFNGFEPPDTAYCVLGYFK